MHCHSAQKNADLSVTLLRESRRPHTLENLTKGTLYIELINVPTND